MAEETEELVEDDPFASSDARKQAAMDFVQSIEGLSGYFGLTPQEGAAPPVVDDTDWLARAGVISMPELNFEQGLAEEDEEAEEADTVVT